MKKYGQLRSEGKYCLFCYEVKIKRAYVVFAFLPMGIMCSHSLH